MDPIKIITKTGDDGTTGLNCGCRCDKTDPRIIACGKIDMLHAQIGMARCHAVINDRYRESIFNNTLDPICKNLFNLMGEIACEDREQYASKFTCLTTDDLLELERTCSSIDHSLRLVGFKLDGWTIYGKKLSLAGAAFDVASKACREAEIEVLKLEDKPRTIITQYLNRLSDCLFLFARACENDVIF